jgi:hypothetical protein
MNFFFFFCSPEWHLLECYAIIHSHRRENLKSYFLLVSFVIGPLNYFLLKLTLYFNFIYFLGLLREMVSPFARWTLTQENTNMKENQADFRVSSSVRSHISWSSKVQNISFALVGTINIHVRFEVFTAVTMKNGVFWNVTPCGSCKNRRFGGT